MARIPSPAFCGCRARPTPAIFNRPGLSAIRYRTGDFAALRAAMLRDIARHPELGALTTRAPDDYAITLIEAFAAMGDVLAFYSERIANEVFLRTATDRASLLRMLRLIGYRLRPGLAAEALLAFTLDAGAETRIRKGLRVMSTPGQDEPPLFFETVEEIAADWRLNALPAFAPPAALNPFAQGTRAFPLAGRPDRLAAGDALAFFAAYGVEEKTVTALSVARDGERLAFEPAVQTAGVGPETGAAAKVLRPLRVFGHDAPDRYQEYLADPALSPQSRWVTRTAGTAPYLLNLSAAVDAVPLDRTYDDLKPGARLLIDRGAGAAPRMMTAAVISTAPAPAAVGQLQGTVTWARLGRTLRGRPVAVVSGAGAAEALARSGVSTAMALDADSAGATWSDLGGLPIAADPAALRLGARTLFLVRGADARLRVNARGASGWSGWADLGGLLTSAPAAASDDGARIFAVARGALNLLFVRVEDGALDIWRPLFGALTSAPVPVSWGAGHMAVLARGPDRALWARSWTGPGYGDADWTPWASLGGTLAGPPAAAAPRVGALDVVARTDGGGLIHRRLADGRLEDWIDLGGGAAGDPAIIRTGADAVAVFVRGTDGELWTRARTGAAWGPWLSLGGALAGDPSVATGGGVTLVAAEGVDGRLVLRRAVGAALGAWETPGGGLGAVADRRRARLWEIAAQPVAPRGYALSGTVSGGSVAARLADAPGLSAIDKGRRIVLDDGATRHAATVTATRAVASTPGDPPDHLLIDFDPAPPAPMTDPVLQGNVATATHGETQGTADPQTGRVSVRLGGGDAAIPFRRFTLPKAPLTYRASAITLTGAAELEVRVSGETWTEVPSLFGRGPAERVYVARQNDAGDTTLAFGDGRTGARPRTGALNVEAAYRVGSGLIGRVKAGQLSIPLERPVGLRGVTNPFAAEGGADPETRDKARAAGPASVRAFGRAVSLRDFEALALSSGLVAKASATWVWRRLERMVHLTVAGEAGAPLGADQLSRLRDAIDAARDPNRPFALAEFCPAPVVVSARVARDPAFTAEDVAAAARAALAAHLAFDARGLGHPLHASNALAALQAATGVRAAMLELFHFRDWTAFSAAGLAARLASAAPVQPHVLIRPARPRPASDADADPIVAACFPDGPPAVLPAELAVVEDASTDLTVTVVEAL
jgi:hypothetical protein